MMTGWGPMGGGWGWGFGFGWLVLIALAILVGWLVVNGGRQPPIARTRPPNPEPSALEILERRYASGELSDEQFERMRQRLEAAAGAPAGPFPGSRPEGDDVRQA
jgi:putative membrane protein